ncbi:MAG: hypothetical protein ACRDVK_06030 [Acidimicrobiia bacterium]
MTDRADGRLVELAQRRFGVATWDEARQSGLTDRQIERRIRHGAIHQPAPGALVVGAAPRTWEQDVAVAVLSSGEGAAASHMTAAALWGMLNTSGGRVDVVVPRWDRNHRKFIVHESLDLISTDVRVHRGIQITTAARTVVDCGAVFRSAVPEIFKRGERLGLVDAESVGMVVKRVAKRGRSGVGPAKALLRNLRLAPDSTESWAEDIYLRVSREAGFPEPIQQHEIKTIDGWFICRCDFAYPEVRLAIFIDGFAYHSDQQAFQTDRVQGNELSLIGWRYLRFTYLDLTQRPQYMIQQVRSALSSILA